MSAPTTRDVLIDAAIGLFRANGYQSTTVDQIAQAAGLTTGAIYVSFSSKEEVFACAAAHAEDVFEASVLAGAPQSIRRGETIQRRLASYLHGVAVLMTSEPRIMEFRSIAGTEMARYPQIGETHGDVLARRRTFIADLLRDTAEPEAPRNTEDFIDVTLLAAEGIAAMPVLGSVRDSTSFTEVAATLSHLLLGIVYGEPVRPKSRRGR